MTPDQLVALANQPINLDTHRVVLLMQAGLVQTPFDIQKYLRTGKTPWRIGRCEEVYELSCKIFAIISKDIRVNKTIRSSAKSLHDISRGLLAELATATGRELPPQPRNLKGINCALNLAMKHTGDTDLAVQLLTRYMAVDHETLGGPKVRYPSLLLPTTLAAYLSAIPPMPDAIYERSVAKKLSFWYNFKTKQWEPLS